MNDLLLSEIKSEKNELLQTFLLLETHIFAQQSTKQSELDELVTYCQAATDDITDAIERAEVLINALFVDQLFIDNQRSNWPVIAYKTSSALAHKLISPTLKAVLIAHVANACGCQTDIVFVPEKAMLRIVCDDNYAIIFDPVTGESLNWHELDVRMSELAGDPFEITLDKMKQESLVLEHIRALKAAFIKEQSYDNALKCVDMLLALNPNDPFERRDRGFLLHQLDCFKVAYDDYQYFVEQCPKDPAAQLLKLQLEKISIAKTILH
ncbi:Regulator of sirC expression, contains transglutaminase-like and TPR domains [Colwellia chukchiensis]|uniref:Regulator of sirC expression, contains transglutaminase-like and TPR domains n=1 Tax=Colwellia chukchiensis TaxID=641665 RepID=A0A1H7GGX4_9GAMM|nr:tetratricopeptide repeat protein [Colwellia chukchiensis]SEK35720.1 Regulator of sirC expression, contains transglutaminase-like and TPR domains [Colwellia chukchiensis]